MLIKIFGGKSEGKSTIARLLSDFLKSQGVNVDNTDDDSCENLQERLDIIKSSQDGLKIEIKTINYGRESLPDYAKKYNEKN